MRFKMPSEGKPRRNTGIDGVLSQMPSTVLQEPSAMRGFHSAFSDQAGLYFVDSIEFLMGFEPHFGRFWIVFGRGDGGQ
jgi:hypothetical protein